MPSREVLYSGICAECGKEFVGVSWYNGHTPKFCSRKCACKSMHKDATERRTVVCCECEKEFHPTSPSQKTCCEECRTKMKKKWAKKYYWRKPS